MTSLTQSSSDILTTLRTRQNSFNIQLHLSQGHNRFLSPVRKYERKKSQNISFCHEVLVINIRILNNYVHQNSQIHSMHAHSRCWPSTSRPTAPITCESTSCASGSWTSATWGTTRRKSTSRWGVNHVLGCPSDLARFWVGLTLICECSTILTSWWASSANFPSA